MENQARQFGTKVKATRKERGLTLDDLGQLCGVSKSTLSKIENGVTTASFETVLKVSRALQINFIHMSEVASSDLPSGLLAVTKSGMAELFRDSHYDYYAHSTDLMTKNIVPLEIHIHDQSLPPPEEWSTHIGEEFLYVISGAVELHTQFYAPKQLVKGESAHFDSSMRHAYVNVSDKTSIILSICSGDAQAVSNLSNNNEINDASSEESEI